MGEDLAGESSRAEIPYVKQQDTPGNQLCGAASLCMVYQSFGLPCVQEEIWESIAPRSFRGSRRAQTYRLAADALKRGLSALVLQARHPWPILQAAHRAGVRIILNHRIQERVSQGHYSVLVGIDEANAVLHDPQSGPDRSMTRDALLELWKPGGFRSEVTGHVLVAVAATGTPLACAACGKSIAATMPCRVCRKEMPLQPVEVLGCASSECEGRLWEYLYCPFCDMRTATLPEVEAK